SSGPAGATKPAGFDPSNPADPAYDFASLDQQVRLAAANGLQPVISFDTAPLWAQDQSPHPGSYGGYTGNSYKPDPQAVAQFAHALALRYGGACAGLPPVRYWQLCHGPHRTGWLSPQFGHVKPFPGGVFRGGLDP